MLFLGNSYTFVNELDQVVAALYEEAGEPIGTVRLAEAGYRFVDHVAQLEAGGSAWDAAFSAPQQWVVLQEQSQIPGFPANNAERIESGAAAVELDAAVAAAGGTTVFLMTWGRRDGDADNASLYPDFSTMNALLDAGYLAYATDAAEDGSVAYVAPVGRAFARVWASEADPLDPGSAFYALYQGDGSHPSPDGTWLAACVLYSTLTGRSAEGLAPSISVSDADGLAAHAWAAVEASTDLPMPEPEGGSDSGTTPRDTAGEDSAPAEGDGDADGDADGGSGACGCAGSGRATGLAWVLGLAVAGRRRLH